MKTQVDTWRRELEDHDIADIRMTSAQVIHTCTAILLPGFGAAFREKENSRVSVISVPSMKKNLEAYREKIVPAQYCAVLVRWLHEIRGEDEAILQWLEDASAEFTAQCNTGRVTGTQWTKFEGACIWLMLYAPNKKFAKQENFLYSIAADLEVVITKSVRPSIADYYAKHPDFPPRYSRALATMAAKAAELLDN